MEPPSPRPPDTGPCLTLLSSVPPLAGTVPAVSPDAFSPLPVTNCDRSLPIPNGPCHDPQYEPPDKNSDRTIPLPNGNCHISLSGPSKFVFGRANSEVPSAAKSSFGSSPVSFGIPVLNTKKQSNTTLASVRKSIAARRRAPVTNTNTTSDHNDPVPRKRRATISTASNVVPTVRMIPTVVTTASTTPTATNPVSTVRTSPTIVTTASTIPIATNPVTTVSTIPTAVTTVSTTPTAVTTVSIIPDAPAAGTNVSTVSYTVPTVLTNVTPGGTGNEMGSEPMPPPTANTSNTAKTPQPLSYAKILNATLRCDNVTLKHITGPNNPEEAIEIPMEVVRLGSIPYEHSLYGYFIGRSLPFRQVCYHIEKMWVKFGLKKITTNGNGYFFFKFDGEDGVQGVLQSGPWIIQNIPIFVQRWEVGLALSKQRHTSVPLWVKLHHMPGELLTGPGISHVASSLGKPLALDAYTTEMCKGGTTNTKYARVLIEFNADSEWRESLKVAIPKLDGSGKVIQEIGVEYPWRPPHCTDCQSYGHDNKRCSQNVADKYELNRGPFKQQEPPADEKDLQRANNRQFGNKKPSAKTADTQTPLNRTKPKIVIRKPSSTKQSSDTPPTKTHPSQKLTKSQQPQVAPPVNLLGRTKPTKLSQHGHTPINRNNIRSTQNSHSSTQNRFQSLADLDVSETLDDSDDPVSGIADAAEQVVQEDEDGLAPTGTLVPTNNPC